MKKALFVFSLFLMAFAARAQTTYYVETSGNDGNPGTQASPYATVQGVINNEVLGPGDSILVGAGTWTDEPITFTTADDGDVTGFVILQGTDSATTIFAHSFGSTNAIHLNGANYVKIRNIKMDDASDDVMQISGGDNNVIENCWILNGFDQVSIETAGTNTADNNIIRDCLLESDAYTYIDINGSNAGGTWICSNTQIYDNVMRFVSGGSASPGIELSFADDTKIYRNRIIGATIGIEIRNTGGGDNTEIYNNYIKTSGDGFYNNGTSATSSNGTLRHNSFYSSLTCAYFRNLSGSTVSGWDIRNNIFYTTSTSSSEYCLRIEGATDPLFCDYNQFYHPGSARCARINGASQTALTNLQSVDHSAQAGMLGDENSQEGDPLYNNPTSSNNNLMDLAAGSPCYYSAFTIATISTDIYSVMRPINPAIGAFDDIAILPIELIAFDARKDGASALLNWITATEIENDFFTLERSSDTENWNAVGTVLGAGNSNTTLHYEFTDYAPTNGTNYYRLKQTNWDGSSSYSQIRAVDFSNNALTFSLYPNPATTFINVFVPELNDEELWATVYSIQGKMIEKSALRSNRLNLSNIASGVYLIEITTSTGNSIGTERLVVQ